MGIVEQIKEIEFEMAWTQRNKATGVRDSLPYPNGMQQLRTEIKPCSGISRSSICKEFLSKILVFWESWFFNADLFDSCG
jgi:hypothetical protein